MSELSVAAINKLPLLLVVEDSNEDFEAFQRCVWRWSTTIPIYSCVDGDDALEFLYRTGRYADAQIALRIGLILLDLNLPGTDGRQVLQKIKQDENMKLIPVVIFTTSNNPKDIEACYRQGVNSYMIKPMDFNRLKHSIQILIDYWFNTMILPTDVVKPR